MLTSATSVILSGELTYTYSLAGLGYIAKVFSMGVITGTASGGNTVKVTVSWHISVDMIVTPGAIPRANPEKESIVATDGMLLVQISPYVIGEI
jgi:hypothetical protein